MIKDENVTVYAKDDDCESDEDMDIPAHLMSEASASDDEWEELTMFLSLL